MADTNFEILNKYGTDYGDLLRSSIVTTFANINDDDEDITSSPTFEKSEFLKPDDIETFLRERKTEFTILSMNVNSIAKKKDELSILVESLLSKNIGFSVITLQECRITKEQVEKIACDAFKIPGYEMFPQGSICAPTGGLITYVRNDFNATEMPSLYTYSSIFEAQFTEISGPLIKNKITVGNVYRRPKQNENIPLMTQFISQLRPIVNKLRKENSFSVLAGDYNLNLLKVGDVTAYSDFFEFMTSKDFIPMITLPTRFDKKSCSLLDHIWVNKPIKGTLDTAKLSSRVFLKRIGKADHLPCLLSLDALEKKFTLRNI